MKNAIVLAAGKSSRMKSKEIKVLHKIIDKPIINYVSDLIKDIGFENVVFVVGNQKDDVINVLPREYSFSVQEEQLGTGHAVSMATSLKDKGGHTLIIMGDSPLIKKDTIVDLIERGADYDLTVLTTIMPDAKKYGRIVRDKNKLFTSITEYNDATIIEKQIKEVNTGIYYIKNELLFKYLPYIVSKEKDKESKFTDIVKLMINNNQKVQTYLHSDYTQFFGINTRQELQEATKIMLSRINDNHLSNGVTIMDNNSSFIGDKVIIEQDAIIYPGVHIYGESIINSGAIIMPGSFIENSVIGKNTKVNASQIYESQIGSDCLLGPNSLIRKNSIIGNGCRIGAFVEIKESTLYNNVKAAHLAYIGNAVIEENVNIGCGVVTVNYDGKNKNSTYIGKDSFIGSNVNLIAPINVGKNIVIAAGSTVTVNIADGDMVIARAKEVIKEGYGVKYFNKLNNKTTPNNFSVISNEDDDNEINKDMDN